MADGYNVAGGATSGAASGAMMGAAAGSVIPGIGTVAGGIIGGIAGALGGGLLGGKKKKYKAPARASGAVYGYDSYGNLVNKGKYSYNPATGQYELIGGELNAQEKLMRTNLSNNISSLINSVGTTPDAFVRYAKELSDSYYKQGERKLAENTAVQQARIDENLARRGLSTSRAAADIQSEFERRRQNTLADIYDASQRYGLEAQSNLQEQSRANLASLQGYQTALNNIDQSYLAKALEAQKLGQAYENAKAGVDNQNIAMQNQGISDIMSGISQFGSLAGYYLGSKTPATSPNGGEAMKGLGNTNYLSSYYDPLQYYGTQQPTLNPAQFNNVGGSSAGLFNNNIYADQNYWSLLGA